ncbi:MAG: hypothetical protein ACRDPY_26160 [Streptosporangiaceae bacterium]
MYLTPGQRKAVFAVIVIALAALGYYLVVPAMTRSHANAQATATATPTPAATPSQQPTAPAVTTSPVATAGTNIWAWLPFTQQDLAQAASVTTKVAVDYDTYSYTETPQAYVATMGNMITADLAATIKQAYATPGVATLRTNEKQVSTGTAVINSLRAFGPSSLTFVVTAGQRLVSGGQISTNSIQYAITIAGSAGQWQVSDIEPADAGNS